MAGSLYYSLDTARLGTAVIINNLHTEQVQHMSSLPSVGEDNVNKGPCICSFLRP